MQASRQYGISYCLSLVGLCNFEFMQLQEYFRRFSFEEVFAELQLMLENAEGNRTVFQHAYEMMLTMDTIPSKKVIHYQIIDDPESEEYYCGAPDSSFNTTWEVILAKEVIVDEECELSDLEIVSNAFICSIIIGRCPRAFLPEKRTLLGE